MSSSNSTLLWQRIGSRIVLTAGALCIGNLVYQSVFRQQQPVAATQEQVGDVLRRADAADRVSWDKMWSDAGKKAPPLPTQHGVPEQTVSDPSVEHP